MSDRPMDAIAIIIVAFVSVMRMMKLFILTNVAGASTASKSEYGTRRVEWTFHT